MTGMQCCAVCSRRSINISPGCTLKRKLPLREGAVQSIGAVVLPSKQQVWVVD